MRTARQVTRYGPFQDYIANGVRVGDLVFLSGQVGTDAEGAVVGEGDLVAQVRQCYANIEEALGHFDASMADIVDEMVLVTDMEDAMGQIDEVFEVRAKAFGGAPDITQTFVQVAGLVMPELLVEIKCIAHL